MVAIGPSYRHLRKMGLNNLPNNVEEQNNTSILQQETIKGDKEIMSSWTQVTYLEYLQNQNTKNIKEVYVDNGGIITSFSFRLYIDGLTFDNYYIERNEQYVRITSDILIELLSKKSFPVIYKNGYAGYYINSKYEKIDIKKAKLTLRIDGRKTSSNYSNSYNFTFETNKDNLTEKKLDVWINYTSESCKLHKISYKDIKKGMKVYNESSGTCEVVEEAKYPNEIYKIKDLNNKIIEKNIKNDSIYYLPYNDKYKTPFAYFNKCKNEELLMPIKISENNTINIYWKEIEEAAVYYIEIFKLIRYPSGTYEIYKLDEVEINRNEKYFSTNKLINKDLVFIIKAENRKGEIIAQSRGILQQTPQDWE